MYSCRSEVHTKCEARCAIRCCLSSLCVLVPFVCVCVCAHDPDRKPTALNERNDDEGLRRRTGANNCSMRILGANDRQFDSIVGTLLGINIQSRKPKAANELFAHNAHRRRADSSCPTSETEMDGVRGRRRRRRLKTRRTLGSTSFGASYQKTPTYASCGRSSSFVLLLPLSVVVQFVGSQIAHCVRKVEG